MRAAALQGNTVQSNNGADDAGRTQSPQTNPSGGSFDFFRFFFSGGRAQNTQSPTGFGAGIAPSGMFGGVNAGPSANAARVNVGFQGMGNSLCFATVRAAYSRAYPGQSVGPLSAATPALGGDRGMQEIRDALARGEAVPVAVRRENGRDANPGAYGGANHCVMLVPGANGEIIVQDPGSRFNNRAIAQFDASGNLSFTTWDSMTVVSKLNTTGGTQMA